MFYTIINIFFRKQQIFAMPVFDMIETLLVKHMEFAPTFALRLSVRTLYVGMSTCCTRSMQASSVSFLLTF